MSVVTVSRYQLSERIKLALREVRKSRHQPDCQCRSFDGFCCKEEKSWSMRVDSLIDQIRDTDE